jgi:hypothetical protein
VKENTQTPQKMPADSSADMAARDRKMVKKQGRRAVKH